MHSFYGFIHGFAAWFRGHSDEDTIDKWNRIYTVVLFLIFCIFVSSSNYVGEPVLCWNTGSLKDHDGYINTVCWISNTYWLPLRDQIPERIPEREELEINYYQWVPVILIIQAFMFYIPHMVWRGLRERPGMNIKNIVKVATGNDMINSNKRQDATVYLSAHLHDCLRHQRHNKETKTTGMIDSFSKFCCLAFCCQRSGSAVFNMYMLVKLLYLLNVLVQLVVIDIFMQGNWSHFYGFEVIHNLKQKHAWRETGKFPRITMCDFEIRVLGNLHRHTVQCVLPINMFNEKIYIFIWFWCLVLAAMTTWNIFVWLVRMWIPSSRLRFIKNHLRRLLLLHKINSQDDNSFSDQSSNSYPVKGGPPAPPTGGKKEGKDAHNHKVSVALWRYKNDKGLVRKFVYEYLRYDGLFVLRMVALNSNDLAISDLIREVWMRFLEDKDENDKLDGTLHDGDTMPSSRRSSTNFGKVYNA